MRDVDVSEMREALSAMKREEAGLSQVGPQGRKQSGRLSEIKREQQRQNGAVSDLLSSREEAFRNGIATRLKATDVLATHARPDTPIYTTLDTPFLIWAFRSGGPPTSWARRT